jgi:Leucine-rich repeat (LRR) protein
MKLITSLLALLAFTAIAGLAQAHLSPQEINAFSQLMASMPGLTDPNGDYAWDSQAPGNACSFEGITCDSVGGSEPNLQYVYSIYLYGFTGGSLPNAIGDFKNLSGLRMVGTGLEGRLPPTLSGLVNLYSLEITEANVIGPLPDVSAMTDLHFLTITDTKLSDTLPDSWTSLRKMQYLILSSNYLSGTIPVSWTTWRSVQILDLSNNFFAGNAPGFVGNVNLRKLDLSGNRFTGTLPTNIGPTLMEINLSQNQFTGTIPSWNMQWRLPNFKKGQLTWFVLNLKNNSLVGTIPDIFDSAPYWDTIDLTYNKLTGTIPKSLTESELNVWNGIFLNNNQLSLCPAPKRFDVTWGEKKLGAPGLCSLNNQVEKPKCSCVWVYENTPCWPIDCI